MRRERSRADLEDALEAGAMAMARPTAELIDRDAVADETLEEVDTVMTYTTLLRRLDPSLRRQSQGQQDRGGQRCRLRQGGWQVRRAGTHDADGVLTVTKELATGERARLLLQTAR